MNARPAPRGCFITFEGGEGAGKSTQARLLADWLRLCGVALDVTREPGGAAGAEEIRQLLVTGKPGRWDPLAETLLHVAARREHVARLIGPALDAGRWVICDRFFDSTSAYQGGGQGVAPKVIDALRRLAIGDFTPDLTLVLDVEPETRRQRVAGRPGAEDRYERMDEAFHARVRAAFGRIVDAEPGRCVLIQADRPVDAVAAAVKEAVRNRFADKIALALD
jgi:dTMP kinase